ncbi:MAG: ferredoxin-thioredoxin reductase catalytic subunit/rhodanese-related sulfurtransferase [Arcobacteraceae bacterium]|jgi:ferredoxin-thioredoxin reductase catalytic subunit/rhodanese-related sulfurtransferase
MVKIDTQSEEFQSELENTKDFANKVCTTNNLVFNPIEEVNQSTLLGLTRNETIYGTKFCPCFMVIGETPEEKEAANNRVCPCTPALEKEIPQTGKCHCGIFCTPEYAEQNTIKEVVKTAIPIHSMGLNVQECESILAQMEVNNDELISLLEARNLGMIDFNLIDVREWMEWNQNRIVGTDYLIPTTSFYNALQRVEDQKDKATILYCYTGSRSAYCQNVMLDMGWKQVSNHRNGIISYPGERTSGEDN